MKNQKMILKALFFLALFFLFIIFFFMRENNGTDNAEVARADAAVSQPREPAPTPSSKKAPSSVETSTASLPLDGVNDPSRALMAIFQAHSPLASAVIHTEEHGAHRYHVGDALPDGGVLAAIRATEVTIHDGGRLITLRMALMGGAGRTTTDADDEELAGNDDGPKMPQRALDLLDKLDLTPVSEDAPEGYRVGEDFPESGTEEVGVKPGDTIVSINGYAVGEYDSDYLVWLSFKDTHKASVLVRNEEGEEFTFHYPDDVKGASLPTPGS